MRTRFLNLCIEEMRKENVNVCVLHQISPLNATFGSDIVIGEKKIPMFEISTDIFL